MEKQTHVEIYLDTVYGKNPNRENEWSSKDFLYAMNFMLQYQERQQKKIDLMEKEIQNLKNK